MKNDGKELIQKAFEMAKESGKEEWSRMTTAVLKNRILVLTKGEFKEADYDATSIGDFVHKVGEEIVSIDHSVSPALVVLKAGVDVLGAAIPSQSSITSFERVRPDLWQAIMDYSSGNKYVWDAVQGQARPQSREDSPEMLLPTITPQEDIGWRKEFASLVAHDLDERASSRLATFASSSASPKILPTSLLGRWNDFVKGKILKTLNDWFEQRTLAPPDRLTVAIRRTSRAGTDTSVEELRELIISAVKQMTPGELLAVSLPPSAVLRTRKEKS